MMTKFKIRTYMGLACEGLVLPVCAATHGWGLLMLLIKLIRLVISSKCFKIFKLQVDYLYVTFIFDRGHYKCDLKDNWERYFIKIRNVPNGETKEVLVTPTPGHYRVMHGAVAFYCIEHATITRRVRCLVKYSSLIGPATLSAARVSSGMGLNMIRAWPHPPE